MSILNILLIIQTKEIKNMINFLPTHCTECGHELHVVVGKNGKYKLICPDTDNCSGVAVKKFQRGMASFDISGIGPSTYKDLYDAGVRDIADLLSITPNMLIDTEIFKDGRALEKLMESIKSVKSLKLSSIIESLQFDKVGSTYSKEIESYLSLGTYNSSGMDYIIREQIEDKDSNLNVSVRDILNKLSKIDGLTIITPTKKSNVNDMKIVEFTGSPKEFGFDTKEDFEKEIEPFGYIHGLLNKNCTYLITDDLSSKTSKMNKATKLGVEILTYGQLIDLIKNK